MPDERVKYRPEETCDKFEGCSWLVARFYFFKPVPMHRCAKKLNG